MDDDHLIQERLKHTSTADILIKGRALPSNQGYELTFKEVVLGTPIVALIYDVATAATSSVTPKLITDNLFAEFLALSKAADCLDGRIRVSFYACTFLLDNQD